MVAVQPAREVDQDRREGRQPRALCDLPDGRGRGVATDVRRHPVADRSAAGTAYGHDARRPSAPGNEGRGMLWYKQSGVFERRAAVNHQLRWPFARRGGDLPLPEPVRSAILASKRPAIWRMSVSTACRHLRFPRLFTSIGAWSAQAVPGHEDSILCRARDGDRISLRRPRRPRKSHPTEEIPP